MRSAGMHVGTQLEPAAERNSGKVGTGEAAALAEAGLSPMADAQREAVGIVVADVDPPLRRLRPAAGPAAVRVGVLELEDVHPAVAAVVVVPEDPAGGAREEVPGAICAALLAAATSARRGGRNRPSSRSPAPRRPRPCRGRRRTRRRRAGDCSRRRAGHARWCRPDGGARRRRLGSPRASGRCAAPPAAAHPSRRGPISAPRSPRRGSAPPSPLGVERARAIEHDAASVVAEDHGDQRDAQGLSDPRHSRLRARAAAPPRPRR